MAQKSFFIHASVVISILMVIAGCNSDKNKAGKAIATRGRQAPKVDGYVLKPQLLEDEITVSGSLVAYEEVELKNEIAGRVVLINLPEGKFVKEGTLLVKLFDDDLQANLKKFKSQLALQEEIFKRQSELFKISGISQNEYDQTILQINSLKAEIEVQNAQIRKTEVLAPFNGVIGLRNISLGAVVTPSTLLATIREEDKIKLDFSVPEKYSSKIKPGLNVEFYVSGSNSPFYANVMATEREIEASTRNLRVRALVNSRSDDLIPGAFTNVKLKLNENPQALLIPTQAIIPQARNKSVIVCKNGTAKFITVKTGIRTASSIEILDGLEAGDTIVTTGVMFLREGMKLSFSSIKSDEQ